MTKYVATVNNSPRALAAAKHELCH